MSSSSLTATEIQEYRASIRLNTATSRNGCKVTRETNDSEISRPTPWKISEKPIGSHRSTSKCPWKTGKVEATHLIRGFLPPTSPADPTDEFKGEPGSMNVGAQCFYKSIGKFRSSHLHHSRSFFSSFLNKQLSATRTFFQTCCPSLPFNEKNTYNILSRKLRQHS